MTEGKNKHFSIHGFTLIEVIISLGIFGLIIGGLFSLLPWGVDKVNKLTDRNTALGMVDAVQVELERLGFSVVEHGTKRLDGLYDPTGAPEDISNGDIRSLILVAPKNGNIVSLERVIEVFQPGGQKKLTNKDLGGGETETLDKAVTDYGGTIYFKRFEDQPISLEGFQFPKDNSIVSRWIEPKDRYFAIVCSQFAKQPRSDSDPPSRHFHHPSNGYLSLQVDIQWPYKIYDPAGVDFSRVVEPRYRSSITFPLAIVR
tara:strand:- start:2467 stop:3240 length:774 start_codon:yes stop_codon:yes gene_type:complete